MPIQSTPQKWIASAHGPIQPPKNSVTATMDMIVRPAYSLR